MNKQEKEEHFIVQSVREIIKKEMEGFRHDIYKKVKELNKKIDDYSGDIQDRFQCQQAIFNGVKNTNENVEESLLNVLLAIRQNEYLKAWYPAQQGYPEMKVVGKHPASK